MGSTKVRLLFSGFKEMAEKLDELGGDLKKTAEKALVKSKAAVTVNLVKATQKSNFPAHGKYSTGRTRHSIDTSKGVIWEGTTGFTKVGFNLYDESLYGGEGGLNLTSIFLMYGTPRMKKVQAMYDAVYGSKTKTRVRKIQKEIFAEAIKKKMEG